MSEPSDDVDPAVWEHGRAFWESVYRDTQAAFLRAEMGAPVDARPANIGELASGAGACADAAYIEWRKRFGGAS